MRSYRLIAIVILVALVAVASFTRVWTFGADLLMERGRDFSIVPSEHEGWSDTSRTIKHEINQCEGTSVTVHNSAGDIVFEGLTGDITASAGLGNIEATHVVGNLDLEVSSGNLIVTSATVLESMRLKSSMGDISFNGNLGKSNLVHSSSGDISMSVPSNACVNLDAQTASGKFTSNLPVENLSSQGLGISAQGLLGSGTPRGNLTISSSMGDVSIVTHD